MAVEKNLIQIQSELKSPSITDETLVKFANGSSASVPSFLALMEMSRRKQLEEGSKSYDASNQQSIKDQLTNALTAPTQMKGALTGAPANQVNPTATPTGIAMGAAPANQVNPTQAPPQPATIGTVGAAEGGLMSLPVNHFNSSSYAGGGIVAFAEGGLNSEEKQLSSFPQERRLSPQSLDEASIMAALAPAAQPVESAPRGRGASGFQSVLDSLPKVQANTMPAPQELTREQLYENIKENQRLAGVSQDPYAEVNKRQAAIEARQKAGYEQQGLDRLLTQLNAFAKADPARGTGYAGAVSSDASMALEQQQNALREKQEQAQLDYAKNIAKEEDARRRGDATGIQAALEAQKKDKLEFAKLGQEDQKLESYRMNTAANVYQTDEYAKARRDAAAQAAANKPDPDDVLYNRIMAKAETDFTIKMLTKKQELLDIGSDEYNAIENEKYRLLSTYFAKRPDLMPKKPEASVSSKPPETPGWWSRNAPAILGGSPTVSFDKLPK